MSLNSFFQFFVPKETKFYPLYQKQAEYIDKAAKLLRQMLIETDLERLENLKKEIKACETDGLWYAYLYQWQACGHQWGRR